MGRRKSGWGGWRKGRERDVGWRGAGDMGVEREWICGRRCGGEGRREGKI